MVQPLYWPKKNFGQPDQGNVGTAAYLDVFGSIYAVMKELKKQGYTVEDIPDSVEGRWLLFFRLLVVVLFVAFCQRPSWQSATGLQKSILEDPEAAMSMSELNVEYRMSVEEYKESSCTIDPHHDVCLVIC